MNAPVERKVIAGTTAAAVATALVTLAMYALSALPVVAAMPSGPAAALEVLVSALIVGGVTLAAGYQAAHTPRPYAVHPDSDGGHADLGTVLVAFACAVVVLAVAVALGLV
jgi:hypothetical protein